ncbi:MAG TPA: DUF3313 family protein [Rhizomicrobium sp.]|nr:DUF3313 family protein [Rhizomicrobium sp.]
MRPRTFVDHGLFVVSFTVALGIAPTIMPASAAEMQAQANEPAPAGTKRAQTPSGLGLERTTETRLRITYTLPGADWTRFKTIQLHPLSVPPDAADATPTNVGARARGRFILGDREVSALQDAFAQQVRSVLGAAGYNFVDTPQADTLIVAPQVTDIRLTAPLETRGVTGRTRNYTRGSGSIALAAVFADGGSGEVVGITTSRSRPANIWRINNRVTNMADARVAFNEWARALRDTIRGGSSGR